VLLLLMIMCKYISYASLHYNSQLSHKHLSDGVLMHYAPIKAALAHLTEECQFRADSYIIIVDCM